MIRELHIPEAGEPVHQGWVLLDHCVEDILGERKVSAQLDEEDSMAPLRQLCYQNAARLTILEEELLPDQPVRWTACS